MKRENMGVWERKGVRGLVCNGREERERGREALEERERKWEKRRRWAQ
jgi:hypothetical protein